MRRDVFLLVLAVLTTVFGVWSLLLYRRRKAPPVDPVNTSPPPLSERSKVNHFEQIREAGPDPEILRSDAVETRKAEDKVCPTCGERYSFSSFACPKDNTALRTLN